MTRPTGQLSLPCIVCGKVLQNIPGEANHPLDALAFVTQGHYGSTAFDPCDGSLLEINVCDVCVEKAIVEHKVLQHPAEPAA